MVWSALAYSRGMLVKPTWVPKGINFQTTDAELKIPDNNDPKLIWDMRGIMKNRPDPFPLPFNPEQTYLDSGLKWGEEIIDLIMADRGRVIIPLRNLRGFGELDEALTYTDDAIIGIDWSDSVESISKDFSIDIAPLKNSPTSPSLFSISKCVGELIHISITLLAISSLVFLIRLCVCRVGNRAKFS